MKKTTKLSQPNEVFKTESIRYITKQQMKASSLLLSYKTQSCKLLSRIEFFSSY